MFDQGEGAPRRLDIIKLIVLFVWIGIVGLLLLSGAETGEAASALEWVIAA